MSSDHPRHQKGGGITNKYQRQHGWEEEYKQRHLVAHPHLLSTNLRQSADVLCELFSGRSLSWCSGGMDKHLLTAWVVNRV